MFAENLMGRISGIAHRVFRNGERTQEEGDNRFSPEQAQVIAWFVFWGSGRGVSYTIASDAVFGNENIPEALRKAIVEEIREQRGMTTGKPREELAALGRQFLEVHLGSVEGGRISRLLDRKE